MQAPAGACLPALSPASRFQTCMTSQCSLPTHGLNVGPSKARACCGFCVARASCSSASAGTPPLGRGNSLCHLGEGPSLLSRAWGCVSLGSRLGKRLVPSPSLSPRHPQQRTQGWAVRRLLTEDEARRRQEPRPGLTHTSRSVVCVSHGPGIRPALDFLCS